MTRPSFLSLRIWIVAISAMAVVGGCTDSDKAEFVHTVPWALTGAWLVGDLHTHSRFSDGALSADDLVDLAVRSGCQVLALTDHGDLTGGVRTAGAQYMSTLGQLRKKYPNLILMGGIEWNIAPYEGREHVNLLVDSSIEAEILPAFREQFDSVRLPGEEIVSADKALDWLKSRIPASAQAVLFYNHPSRKQERIDNAGEELKRWRQQNERLIGFEGSPGHQRSPVIGSYDQRFETINRWDPVVANIGGVWDDLLDQGDDVWAALANSDYHNDKLDYAPCAFSRVHLQVSENTQRGVLEALAAGTFWAEHGPILSEVLFVASSNGLDLPAVPGEIIAVPSDQKVTFHLAVQRHLESKHASLMAELITNCLDGKPELVGAKMLAPDESQVQWDFPKVQPGGDGKSCYARSRVRKKTEQKPDLLAYTNAIRILIE